MERKAVSGIMLMLLLTGTLGLARCNNLSSSKNEGGTQTDKMSNFGSLSASTAFSEGFEGAFPGDNWSVGDENPNNDLDYWDDTPYRSQAGSWSGWCAQIGSQTTTTTVLYENFEGVFPGSWTVEDFDSGSGNDIWDDTSYRRNEGSRSAWCAELGTKAGTTATIFYEDFEGAWPGSWMVYDSNEANGYDYWGDYSGKSHVGSWSGYCADEGAHPMGCGYDDNMDAYMYRNVSLSGYSSVSLSYWYWLNCESGYDNLYVTYFDGSWHDIDQHTGNISLWQYSSVSIPTSAVYVGLHFHSDGSVCNYAGAFVDQVQLAGTPQVPNNSVHEYDNDMETYMYHSVSLSGYSSVSLSYWYWLNCESGYDNLYVTYFDGSWHDIDEHTGNSGGWQYSSVSIPTSAIYVGFHFSSDSSVCNYEGAYIDQVILRGVASIPNTSLHSYDDNMDARMVRKYTIDASTWGSATLYYWAWYQTESSFDYCQAIVTDDAGAHWYYIGEQLTGTSSWSYHSLLIPDTYLTSLFNIGFVFHSDGSIHNYEGVYLDGIVMEYVPGPIYIRADGSVDPPTAPIHRNENLYTLTDNIYTSALDGIVIERSNVVLDGTGYELQGIGGNTGIRIQDRSNVTIRNIRVRAFANGIDIADSSNNIIQTSNITDCINGIQLSGSSYNTLTGNSLSRIYNCTITLWSGSSRNLIQANNLMDNDNYGIVLLGSGYNNITGNTVAATDQYGIYIASSFNNNLTWNNIRDNYGGIRLQSSTVLAHHNNFINNSIQAYTYASSSFWDDGYPSGGNYWSDYAGLDFFSGPDQNVMGSDRIGDTRYIIDGNNQDRYPLMQPWTPAGILTQYTWPMFRQNPAHTGYTESPAPRTNQTLWTYTTGGYVYSSPAVADGKVYVGSYDNKVYCLNASTGAPIWNYTTDNDISSSPTVADGKVYVGSVDNKVYCLNALTGARIWNYTTGGRVSSSPVVVNGKVYVGSYDNKVYCLNALTGGLIWNYTTGAVVISSPAIADGRVYVGSMIALFCLDAFTGGFIWGYNTGGRVDSSPAVVYGRVYVGSLDSKVYCFNASTGAKLWSYPTGYSVYSSPAVADGRVYVGSYDNKVYCLDAFTGGFMWSYPTGDDVYSSPAVADGKVYVTSWDKKVYCLNALTGACIWSYTASGNLFSSPAVADGVVYVGSYDNRVYAFGNVTRVPEDYPTIQGAIDASAPGGTVVVAPGTYNETLIINKPLTLMGKSGSSTTFAGGGYGVAVTITNTYDVTITNIVITNWEKGVFVDNSHNCKIYNNMIYYPIADSGIKLQGDSALSNIIYNNKIYGNNIAINVTDTSTGNIIYANTISGNNIGIKLSHSTGNTIYWNSFDRNLQQVSTGNPSGNVWDKGYPSGGNYWSNYQGIDANGDGIGDTPYIIDVYNQDRYPLMIAYGWTKMAGDVNGDERVDASDLHDVSGAYGSKPGDNNWNANCDFYRDNKIEVMDLYHLGKNYGLTYP